MWVSRDNTLFGLARTCSSVCVCLFVCLFVHVCVNGKKRKRYGWTKNKSGMERGEGERKGRVKRGKLLGEMLLTLSVVAGILEAWVEVVVVELTLCLTYWQDSERNCHHCHRADFLTNPCDEAYSSFQKTMSSCVVCVESVECWSRRKWGHQIWNKEHGREIRGDDLLDSHSAAHTWRQRFQ